MKEELISKSEYMRRYKVGFARLQEMIHNGELEMKGGKILIKQQAVPIEMYEKVITENAELKTKLQMIKGLI